MHTSLQDMKDKSFNGSQPISSAFRSPEKQSLSRPYSHLYVAYMQTQCPVNSTLLFFAVCKVFYRSSCIVIVSHARLLALIQNHLPIAATISQISIKHKAPYMFSQSPSRSLCISLHCSIQQISSLHYSLRCADTKNSFVEPNTHL